MAAEENDPKIGAGHFGAMARQGLAELRAALYTDSNVAQPAQYGMAGVPTPSEVSNARAEVYQEPLADSRSAVEERLPSPEPIHDGRDDKPRQLERE